MRVSVINAAQFEVIDMQDAALCSYDIGLHTTSFSVSDKMLFAMPKQEKKRKKKFHLSR